MCVRSVQSDNILKSLEYLTLGAVNSVIARNFDVHLSLIVRMKWFEQFRQATYIATRTTAMSFVRVIKVSYSPREFSGRK